MARQHKVVRKTHRFTIDGTPAFFKKIDRLGQQLNTTSRASTIRIAVEVLDYVTQRVAAGQTIQFVKPNGKVEAVIIARLLPLSSRNA